MTNTFLGKRPYALIAELGSNHNGSKARALNLIVHAAAAGATHVKFQLWTPDLFYAKQVMPEQYENVKRLALDYDWLPELSAKAAEYGVGFLCTPFDEHAVKVLNPFVEAHKIASGDLTNVPLLREVARTGKPVLLSTGAATVEEIENAALGMIFADNKEGNTPITVMHCVSAYPTPLEEANIGAINDFQKHGFKSVGYSDHTANPYAIIAAHALGARVFEVHFDLPDRSGAEATHSLTGDKFGFIRAALDSMEHGGSYHSPGSPMDYHWTGHFRSAVYLLAHGEKRVMPCEASERDYARRGIYLAEDVKAGEPLAGKLVALRPAKGAIGMEEWDKLQASRWQAYQDMKAGQPLLWKDMTRKDT